MVSIRLEGDIRRLSAKLRQLSETSLRAVCTAAGESIRSSTLERFRTARAGRQAVATFPARGVRGRKDAGSIRAAAQFHPGQSGRHGLCRGHKPHLCGNPPVWRIEAHHPGKARQKFAFPSGRAMGLQEKGAGLHPGTALPRVFRRRPSGD